MKIRYKKNTIIYTKGMTTKDCIDVIQKRINKREEEMKIYEHFYLKYINLKKKQDEDYLWLFYLKDNPDFITND